MKWRNGLIGIELMATISLSAFYGVRQLKYRADSHRLTAPCTMRDGCPEHPIAVRSPKFGRALLTTSVVGGLLVPYAALSGKFGRSGIAATLVAASSLGLALGLRYEFVQVDQTRRDRDNRKAGIGMSGVRQGDILIIVGDEDEMKALLDDVIEHYANRLAADAA